MKSRTLIVAGAAIVAAGALWMGLRMRRHPDRASDPATADGRAGRRGRAHLPPAGPPAIVSGRVLGPDGRGVAEATVVLQPAVMDDSHLRPGAAFRAPRTIAAADGTFTLTEVPAASYALTASSARYAPAATRLELAPGESRSGVDLVLAEGGLVVDGTVSDVGGGPIPGALVVAISTGPGAEWPITSRIAAATGMEGRYRMRLPPGTYALHVKHPDYVPQQQGLTLRTQGRTRDFALVPGGVVFGEVRLRPAGTPVPGASVSSKGGESGTRSSDFQGDTVETVNAGVTTDEQGRFVLTGLGSGAVDLRATAARAASSEATRVELGIAEQLTGVIVWVEPAYRVSGRVLASGATPTPVANAVIAATDPGMTNPVAANEPTGPDGRFELEGLRPGGYMVITMADGFVSSIGHTFTVADRDLDDVVLTIDRGATISGRVIPAAPAEVWLEPDLATTDPFTLSLFIAGQASGHVLGVRARPDGTFTIRGVPPAAYALVATASDGRAGRIDVKLSGVGEGLEVALGPRPLLTGRVLDRKGRPVAGQVVRALRAEHGPFAGLLTSAEEAVTAADGRFAVPLDPGRYDVVVFDGQTTRPWARDKPGQKPAPVHVTIEAGRTPAPLELAVEASDQGIRGRVLDGEGAPVADSWVTALPLGSRRDVETRPVLSDAQGRFELRDLYAGSYRLVADDPRVGGHAEVESAATGTEVVLRLEALASLEGAVRFQGSPVATYQITLRRGEPPRAVESKEELHPFARKERRMIHAADGRYRFGRLAAGSYQVVVTSEKGSGYVTTRLEAGKRGSLDVTLLPWAGVRGRVVDVLSGTPIAGAAVYASSEHADESDYLNQFLDKLPGRARTDAEGRFRLQRLWPGETHLTAIVGTGTFRPALSETVQLRPGEDKDLGAVRGLEPPERLERGSLGLDLEVKGEHLVVKEVAAGGPAARAGLLAGDRVVGFDEHAVVKLGPGASILWLETRVKVGDRVELACERNGQALKRALLAVARDER